jgi:hypothetical protein
MVHSDHTQVSKHLIGLAGRYYVLFRLSQQGILATLAAPRTALVGHAAMECCWRNAADPPR